MTWALAFVIFCHGGPPSHNHISFRPVFGPFWDLWFRVLGFRILEFLGFGVWGLGKLQFQGFGLRILASHACCMRGAPNFQGSGFRAQDLGFRMLRRKLVTCPDVKSEANSVRHKSNMREFRRLEASKKQNCNILSNPASNPATATTIETLIHP